MSKRFRRNHSALFKANVATDAQRDYVHPNQVTEWRRQLHERAAEVFGRSATSAVPSVELKELHAKIGHLTLRRPCITARGHSMDRSQV